MFWGLILKTNKKYSQTLKTSFHLSQASLDESASNNEPVQVMYMQDDNAYLLCTLQKNKTTQCALDLNFATGDKVCFSTKGNGIVHLTGYLVQDEMDFDDELGDEEDEEITASDEEDMKVAMNDLRNKLKKDKNEPGKKQKVPAQAEGSDESSEGEEEESDEESEDENAEVTMEAADSDEDDSDEEEDDDEDDDEEEDDSDDEDEVEEPKAKQMKLEKDKKNKQQNGLQNGHKEEHKKQKKDKENKQQQQQQQKSNDSGKMVKLAGGLKVQDVVVGKGAEAKSGKKVQVYYEGRLQSNNKMFDSTKQGPGFKFTLGRNEVIRGWDLGVVGMKVGGKRKLTIPAALAYGSKGSPPVIPPNSTLVFDVELKNVLN